MDVFTVTSPDIVQLTGASSSSLTALTSVMRVALGKLCVTTYFICSGTDEGDKWYIPLVLGDVLSKLVFGKMNVEP